MDIPNRTLVIDAGVDNSLRQFGKVCVEAGYDVYIQLSCSKIRSLYIFKDHLLCIVGFRSSVDRWICGDKLFTIKYLTSINPDGDMDYTVPFTLDHVAANLKQIQCNNGYVFTKEQYLRTSGFKQISANEPTYMDCYLGRRRNANTKLLEFADHLTSLGYEVYYSKTINELVEMLVVFGPKNDYSIDVHTTVTFDEVPYGWTVGKITYGLQKDTYEMPITEKDVSDTLHSPCIVHGEPCTKEKYLAFYNFLHLYDPKEDHSIKDL